MSEGVLGTIILLIEDEAADSLLIRRAFEKAGVENPIQTIANGDTALSQGNQPHPGLLAGTQRHAAIRAARKNQSRAVCG